MLLPPARSKQSGISERLPSPFLCPSAVRPTTDPSARPPARFRKDDIPIIIMHADRTAAVRPTDGGRAF